MNGNTFVNLAIGDDLLKSATIFLKETCEPPRLMGFFAAKRCSALRPSGNSQTGCLWVDQYLRKAYNVSSGKVT